MSERWFTNRRKGITGKPVCLIVHSMGQYIQSPADVVPAWDWLEQSGLSVHALIHPDGTVIRGAHDDDVAYHAGKSRLTVGDKTFTGLNTVSLGAEFLVSGEHTYDTFLSAIRNPDCYTAAQYEAGAVLYAGWCKAFSLPIERIVAHSDVAGDDVRGDGNGKRDPGDGFRWADFRDRVKALL